MTKFLCGECIHNSDKGGGCLIPKNLGYVDNCNRYLPKDKPIVQTNEEYIHSLNTEQLAEFLADKCNEVVDTVLSDASCDIDDVDNDDYWYRQADFVEWLKQPHTTTKE